MSDSAGRDPMTYRVSDGDRENTAEILRQAAGDGRITLDELDTRLTDTFAARTYAELAQLTDDLPPAGAVGAPLPVLPVDDKPLVLASTGGAIQRKGQWLAPARIEAGGTYSSIQLDFREAVLAGPVTQVDLRTKYGSVLLTLPDGGTAQVDATSSWGSVRSSVPAVPVAGVPHFVITGETNFGSVTVRYASGHKRRIRKDMRRRRRNKGA